jgi:hypothetical protein
MPRSRRRKQKQKKQVSKRNQEPPKQPWTRTQKVYAGLLAGATLIGGVAAMMTFLPRVTVNVSGDLSNPASVQFQFVNINFIPLRKPTYGIMVCEIIYGRDHPALKSPSGPCDATSLKAQPPIDGASQQWFSMDENYTLRLEDMFRVTNSPISRANLIVTISYYPWYLPWRGYRAFGFRTVSGSDEKLYWRSTAIE